MQTFFTLEIARIVASSVFLFLFLLISLRHHRCFFTFFASENYSFLLRSWCNKLKVFSQQPITPWHESLSFAKYLDMVAALLVHSLIRSLFSVKICVATCVTHKYLGSFFLVSFRVFFFCSSCPLTLIMTRTLQKLFLFYSEFVERPLVQCTNQKILHLLTLRWNIH